MNAGFINLFNNLNKMAKQSYKFLTDTISFKSVIEKGKKRRYVTGYISTADIDLYNDIITPKALKSMLNQINKSTIMLDYEHEAWRDDNTIIPVGKIVEAKIDDRGLWVKAELNPFSPKFDNMWGSIKEGFIKAFSIAFKPLKTVMKTIGDTEVRLIEELELLNVALTGAPVNQSAIMTGHSLKSIMMKAITDLEKIEEKSSKDKEEIKMSEEKIDKKDEAPAEEVKEDAPVEESKEEVKEEVVEEKPVESEVEGKAMEKILEEMKSLSEKVEAQKEELKSLKESPVFKSKTPEQPEVAEEPEVKSVLDAIN